MSGHLYYSECLLYGSEADSEHKSACQSRQGNQPAFKNEYSLDQPLLCSHAPESPDVILLLYDQHGEASEDVERYDDDDEDQDHEYGSLFIFHHLV